MIEPLLWPAFIPAIHLRRCERLNALGVATSNISAESLCKALEQRGMVFSSNGATEINSAMFEIDEWLDAQDKKGRRNG